jgi:hypothetical protein
VKVRDDEGVAIRIGPEPCVGVRSLGGSLTSISQWVARRRVTQVRDRCAPAILTSSLPRRCDGVPFGFSVTGAAAQQGTEYRGTQQQQMACTPDVFRLCWSEIPDVSRIVACLVREKPRLSDGCRAVFETTASRPMSHRFARHHLHGHTIEPSAKGHSRAFGPARLRIGATRSSKTPIFLGGRDIFGSHETQLVVRCWAIRT